MGSKYTKRYTEEFKRDAIALVDSSGKTVTAVTRELGISSESLRGWYRKAKADRGEGTPGELSSAEREELQRLRLRVGTARWSQVRTLRRPYVGERGRVPSTLFGRRGAVLSAPLLGDPRQHLEHHLDLPAQGPCPPRLPRSRSPRSR
ncbi:transposase [Streptomyces sp. HUAS TT20]|uniref:transposase n=1 Tax=Streptomyces sp. HUAS TT20 TaxID=3447509 RepID=UPI0021D7F883|nr:transposase [Streptomyces sp. HUAS 15-9]UXY32213.1 transposase [Streptomyces sp. HUAS 15-9]